MKPVVELDGESLTIPQVAEVAERRIDVRLAASARRRMEASRAWVASAAGDASGLTVYGVNTGYGSLARVRISEERIEELSWNLLQSHAAGTGPRMDDASVRAMMLLRANALAKGASGCRPELVDTLCRMLAADVLPEVPSRGSCGLLGRPGAARAPRSRGVLRT